MILFMKKQFNNAPYFEVNCEKTSIHLVWNILKIKSVSTKLSTENKFVTAKSVHADLYYVMKQIKTRWPRFCWNLTSKLKWAVWSLQLNLSSTLIIIMS